jgi:general stress protein 26
MVRPVEERVAAARSRLVEEQDIWLSTGTDEGPWLVPLWFVWRPESALFLATSATSRTARNVRRQPRVRLALQSTSHVVILVGTAAVRPVDESDPATIDSYRAKYAGDPRDWATAAIDVQVRQVHAWNEEAEIADRVVMRDGRWLA